MAAFRVRIKPELLHRREAASSPIQTLQILLFASAAQPPAKPCNLSLYRSDTRGLQIQVRFGMVFGN